MFVKKANLNIVRLLIPGIAVLIAYAALFAIPKQRERNRVATETQQRSAEVEKLLLLQETQQAELIRSQTGIRKSERNDQKSITTIGVLVERNEQSIVRAFSRLLSIFQNHEIECTATDSDNLDSLDNSDTAKHRISLSGSFQNMLAAMESIESKLPHVLATEFSMERPRQSETCRWTIEFQFERAGK